MIGKLKYQLVLIVFALWMAYLTVYFGGPKMTGRLMMIVWFVLMVLTWKPLHKRFRAIAILGSYFFWMIPLLYLAEEPSWSLSEFLQLLFLVLAISAVFLLLGRHAPIERRSMDVASMVLYGHWELLAQQGVPADEIERLKRLSQEERAALWDALFKARDALRVQESDRHRKFKKLSDDITTDPIYRSSPTNVWHHHYDYWRD